MAEGQDAILVDLAFDAEAARIVAVHGVASADATIRAGTVAAHALAALASRHPERWIAWRDVATSPHLSDPPTWGAAARHDLELLHLGDVDPMAEPVSSLGWVDSEAPDLLPPAPGVRHPTWLVSPRGGLARGAALAALRLDPSLGFGPMLWDAARRGTIEGLFPQAEPAMWRTHAAEPRREPVTRRTIARLIARAWGRQWVAVWLLAHARFRARLPLVSALAALRTAQAPPIDAAALRRLQPTVVSDRPDHQDGIAVVIPTLGRLASLEDVLDDLAAQSQPPRRVVVIDQRPGTEEEGEATKDADPSVVPAGARPFPVEWHRVSWMGACRARNLGLARAGTPAECPWLLWLDDDVRFAPDLLAGLVATARAYGVGAVNALVHRPHQDPATLAEGASVRLWPRFNTCVALVNRRFADAVGDFDLRLEGGYGEDFEYGMRLRRAGGAVVYDPARPVLHLKAPAGGFRVRFHQPWHGDRGPSPRPSPTVLLSRHLHQTPTMAQGYALFYVLEHFRRTPAWRWPWSIVDLMRRRRVARRWMRHLAAEPGPGLPEVADA